MSIMWSNLDWVSSIEPEHRERLELLRKRLEEYYKTNSSYYKDIISSETLWDNREYLPYQVILERILEGGKVLELGCGNAAILATNADIIDHYHGIDFSPDLINMNKAKYPSANFLRIEDSNNIPFEDHVFDCVFSVFVIEHVIYPARFISESLRVLKRGGRLMILCPDYMGHLWMASQRLGMGPGTGREKISKGKLLDAVLTGIDGRIRVPVYALLKRKRAEIKPRFFININPICFEDPFKPDVDAVYVTYENEIQNYTSSDIEWLKNDLELKLFCKNHRLIFMEGVKK